jgi:hypothetical protein
MRPLTILAAIGGLAIAVPAQAFEYELQYATYGDVVTRHFAGYAFAGSTVTGDCTYVVENPCSGRGCHATYTYYYQGCTWDLYGNWLATTPGEPPAPAPISTAGGLTIYAKNAQGGTTGIDTAHNNIPFVNTISAQYDWVPSTVVYFLTADKPYPISLTIQSIGDKPLAVTQIVPTAALATITVKYTSCLIVPVKPGKSCRIVLKYDPTTIAQGDNPYIAYDHISVGIVSNSGLAPTTAATVETPIPAGGG